MSVPEIGGMQEMKVVLDPGAYMPEYAHDTDAGADLRSPEWYNIQCPICGKRFHLKPSSVKRFKRHYCSKECHRKAKQEYMAGEKNHQYGLKGMKNSSWRSDRKLSRYGYIQVRKLDHPFRDKAGFVFEHRLAAEQYLLNDANSVVIDGVRYLDPKMEVHHKNFDRTDNSPQNLMVLTHQDHQKIHAELNPNKRDDKGHFVKEKKIEIKVKRVTKTAILPERKSIGAAGFDLCVDSNREITIAPHETVLLKSGIAFSIPNGYFGAIYARSGISTRMGLRPATCVSVIDSDYRGEVGLPIHNDTNVPQTIHPHERICQVIFEKAIHCDLELVDSLDETERGNNGFGSTGRS